MEQKTRKGRVVVAKKLKRQRIFIDKSGQEVAPPQSRAQRLKSSLQQTK